MINIINYKFLITLNAFQRGLLVFGVVAIILIASYFLFVWFKSSLTKDKKNKMMTLSLVIKYKYFLEYLDYMIKEGDDFNLYLVKINNLNLLERKYSENGVRLYLRKVAKDLSVYLPFGGKVAQTAKRDTFIIYYPNTNEDEFDVGTRFKELAEKNFNKGNVNILKRSSVAFVKRDDYTNNNLGNTLISSVRNLGEVILYHEGITNNVNDFNLLAKKINEEEVNFLSVKVLKNKERNYEEIYNVINISNLRLLDYMKKIPEIDQAWVNMDLLENLLDMLYEYNIFGKVGLPVLLNTIEKEEFVSSLQQIVYGSNFMLEQMIISLKITNINYEEKIIRNILTLSNLGVKISLDINTLNKEIYSFIQKYNIDRLEVDDELMDDDNIAELLYFSKVNNLEVIYKTNKSNLNMDDLNVNYITDKSLDLKQTNNKTKRGRR